MKSLKYWIIFTCLLFGPAAFAEEGNLSKQFSACMDKAGGVTASMIDCMSTETKQQDAKLNKAYKDVLSLLSPNRKRQLQEAQRLWIKYREANCKFYYDPDGGTMARVSANNCFMTATADRAKELESIKETSSL
jgi:uncharacterized protein YecT (DUF1311 family)